MKLRALIIDDELNCIHALQQELQKHPQHIEVVGTANSAFRGLSQINNLNPDVVFLDVSMPGGTGFEMLDQIQTKQFNVVITSAHKQYAIDAFDYTAVNYLLKPIESTKLERVIEQCICKSSSSNVETIGDSQSGNISITTNSGHQVIAIQHIIRCEADGAYTFLYTEGGHKLLTSQNIKIFEDQLANYPFARIHKKHLINLKKVKYYTKGKGGHVTLSDGSEVCISFRQKSKFLQLMKHHLVC